MKNELLRKLNNELRSFEGQSNSDEYKNIKEIIEAVKRVDITPLERIAEKFTCNGADAWLKIWTNGNIRRIYLNVQYRNGYRPNFKNGYIEF